MFRSLGFRRVGFRVLRAYVYEFRKTSGYLLAADLKVVEF